MKQNSLYTVIILSLFLVLTTEVSAQKGEKSTAPVANNSAKEMNEHYQKMYQLAIKYGDFSSASQSVYGMMALDTTNFALKDTMANLFFARGAYRQCIQLGEEIFAKQPDNNQVLELLAYSHQSLGNSKEALEYYEKLYPRTKKLYNLYQIVVLQYSLKRVGECNQNIEIILNDPNSTKELVAINIGQGYQQQVPFKAAALNIRGVIAREVNETETAKKCFEEALKISPEFVLAKGNLDELSKGQVPAGDSPKTQPEKKQ